MSGTSGAGGVQSPRSALPYSKVSQPGISTEPAIARSLWVLEAFRLATDNTEQSAAVQQLRTRAQGDSEAGRIFIRLLMEQDEGRYGPTVLEELHLRLLEQHLIRTIGRLRAAVEDEAHTEADERHLFQLERRLQMVRINLINLNPG